LHGSKAEENVVSASSGLISLRKNKGGNPTMCNNIDKAKDIILNNLRQAEGTSIP
jgi:hypothetical protein